MSFYWILIFTIFLGGLGWEIIVELLNLSRMDWPIPKEFALLYNEKKYRDSIEYQKSGIYFSLVKKAFFVGLFFLILIAGVLNIYDQFLKNYIVLETLRGLGFFGGVFLIYFLFNVPFDLYQTFHIEQCFGFNKTTLRVFILDRIKGLLLAGIIGGGLLFGVLLFFEKFGTSAWWLSWIFLIVVQVALSFLAPTLLLPIFNAFEPLKEGDLKTSIENYAKSQGFFLSGIYTMDGSKRSTKANAFFTGFGRFKRLVLFDTLIITQSIEELVAVVAHEVGHYKLKHIPKSLALSMLISGLNLFLVSVFLGNKNMFMAFWFQDVSIYGSLFFAGIFLFPLQSAFAIFSSWLSRRFEYEADHFSHKTFLKPGVLGDALKKLSVENYSFLFPHPLKVFVEYSHPPVLKRLEFLKNLENPLKNGEAVNALGRG